MQPSLGEDSSSQQIRSAQEPDSEARSTVADGHIDKLIKRLFTLIAFIIANNIDFKIMTLPYLDRLHYVPKSTIDDLVRNFEDSENPKEAQKNPEKNSFQETFGISEENLRRLVLTRTSHIFFSQLVKLLNLCRGHQNATRVIIEHNILIGEDEDGNQISTLASSYAAFLKSAETPQTELFKGLNQSQTSFFQRCCRRVMNPDAEEKEAFYQVFKKKYIRLLRNNFGDEIKKYNGLSITP